MLLENFRRCCCNISSMRPTYLNGTATTETPITANAANGGNYWSTDRGWYTHVGFGDTAVTKNDYKLANDNIMDNNLLTQISCSVTNVSPTIRTTITVYKNNGSDDVVVKEMGLVGKTASNAANAPQYNCMIARKVLDTPITVPAGATMAFTYAIDMDFGESVSAS